MGKWKKVKFDQSDFGSTLDDDAAVCFEIHELVGGDVDDLIYSSSDLKRKRKKPNSEPKSLVTEGVDSLDEENAENIEETASEIRTLKSAKSKKRKSQSKGSPASAARSDKIENIESFESETTSPKTKSRKTKNKFKGIPALKEDGDRVPCMHERNETENIQILSNQSKIGTNASSNSKNTKIDWTGVEQQFKLSDTRSTKLELEVTKTSFLDEEWTKVCGVPDSVVGSLVRLQFQKPTEIQKRVLPIAMDGKHDVIAAAETGSGKTLAYVIPAVRRILDDRKENPNCKGPKVLVLLPTRELAIQVSQHVKALSASVFPRINHVAIVGGLTAHKQKRVLMRKNPEIVVATPGRLWQLMSEDEIPHLRQLNQIKSLILDEADRLCEAGYFKDLESVLNFVYQQPVGKESDEETEFNESEARGSQEIRVSARQTMILSATLTVANQNPTSKAPESKSTSTTHIAAIAPILKKVKLRKNYKVVDVTRSTVTAENLIEQKIFCPAEDKDLFLYYCLTALPKGRKLVFANSVDHIRRLSSLFTLLQFETKVLHAHIQQRQRLKNLEKFSTSDDCTLFCTDVAARGLDIRNVDYVIHYHLPKTYETYVHRSGRTARSGCGGISIMLMAPNEAALFVKIVNALNKEENDIAHTDIDYKLVKSLRARVQFAQSIEKIEHKNRKVSRESAWAAGVARDLELEFDDSESKYSKHELSGELGRMKTTLKKMLKAGIQTSSAGIKIKNPVLYLQ